MQLEPVSFNYKGSSEEQYGVRAEQAVKPYREMVVFGCTRIALCFPIPEA